ncbi:MAG: homocysteine S-methyltransferase family protein [Candidatus Aminicenantes bacterium]|nr:homocysteine S-methyltransferase family protein [Candidatus Aminicenantes bacterium]
MSIFPYLPPARPFLLDGAMGTELMAILPIPERCPETANIEHPEAVQAVHRDYFAAGADAVSTNTFGGSPLKLEAAGLGSRAKEINAAAARLAVSVRPPGKYVAGEIGPTGKFLKPQGPCGEDEFEAGFALQAEGLAEGGADFILIETMFDLREALCAVRGARRGAPGLPVLATLTFNRGKRGFFTLMGDGLEKCTRAFEDADLPAFGANCTLSSGDMADLIAAWKPLTSVPLIAQANAGKPDLSSGRVVYSQGEDAYMAEIPRLIAGGARIIGGCCGTTPRYIQRMAALIGAA